MGGGASALSNDGGGSWLHSRYITINNSGSTLTDYQVLVNLTGITFPTNANMSGVDIRFTDSSGELPYWIESWDYTNSSALIWVNVTSISAGLSTMKMWYGNPNATSSNNGTKTFEFFEDWDYPGILDPAFISNYNYWTTHEYWPSTGVVSFSNSKLELTTVDSDWSTALVASKASYPINLAIDMRLNYGCSGIYCSIAYVAKAGWGLENDGTFFNADNKGISVGNYWGNKVLRNTNITDVYDVNSGESQFPNSYETYTVARLSTKSKLFKNYVFDVENSNGYVDTSVNVSFGKTGNWQVPFTIYVDWYKIRKYSEPEPSVSVSLLSNSGGGTWQYSHDLTNLNPGAALTDYQMLVNLTGANFPIEANTSGADVRFTDAGGAELAYWIESWDYANRSALVWVNVTNIPVGASTMRMWYGNPNASSSSNWNGAILPYVDSQATSSAGWNARTTHASLVYNNAMWVLGGYYGGGHKNDVWSSSDGITWTQATSGAGWSPRAQSIALNFENKMWVIGGAITGTDFNDVWNSSDGITWTQATASSFTPARRGTAGVVFNDQMWIAGGVSGWGPYPLYNDVWKSSDGITWTQATANAGWSPRYGHTLLAFDNKLWIIGGTNGITASTDVWYSSDGTTWTRATADAGFGGMDEHSSVVFDNKMWIFGGHNANYSWYSSDGIAWNQATASAGWSARGDHTSVVFNDKVWILGGEEAAGTMKNDVWRMLRKYAFPEPSISFASYNLTGRVLNASSGLGIPGALVKLDTYPQYNATTNSTGDYAMSIPAGTYNVSASAAEYATNTTTLTINGDTVNDFALSILPPIRFINGTVIDSVNRTGIAGAKIFANGSLTTTNALGFYSFAVPSGTYNITATFEPTYYLNSSIAVSTVGKAVAWQDIELLKKPTGTITGNVTIYQWGI